MGMHTNRLIHEKSPYLLQHAHNPVDWYPWGEEAFQKARREDKPVFLSVGYASCHWCHVMERECFQNEEIAALLNRHFVPIKVDREERPDVDRVYMSFVQAATGSGGWPMSVFLTPELAPFFGGTYFPPDNRYGRPGFRYVLERIAEAWQNDREQVRRSSGTVLEQLRRHVETPSSRSEAVASAVHAGFQVFRRQFDAVHGGFGQAPKFPRPAVLFFLLRYWHQTGNAEALAMVRHTLRAMACGGLRDQLGGGFHRYSVDAAWQAPHFEKMLYDQAQLAVAYLEAWQVTGDRFFANVVRDTLDYLLRDMAHPEGGFYSAEDADSPVDASHPERTTEGGYYLWTPAEIRTVLAEPEAGWVCLYYGVESEQPSVLRQTRSLEQLAAEVGEPAQKLQAALERARARLLEHRARRPRPLRDDKILTAWNGLALSAFARAGRVLSEPRYLAAARRTADWLVAFMYRGGRLWRRWREGEAAVEGFLEDHAFLVQGLLDLFESTFGSSDLELALRLTEQQQELFEDRLHGGFFAAREDPYLPLRLKDDYDGAEPSANSVSVWNLLRLAALTGREDLQETAQRTLEAFAHQLSSAPESLPLMLAAAPLRSSGLRQIVVAGAPQDPGTQGLLAALHGAFLPDSVLLRLDPQTSPRLAGPLLHLTNEAGSTGPAVYICENFACRLPITDPSELAQWLERRGGAPDPTDHS